MKTLKFHIVYLFRNGPWGGENQFLKALKGEFERRYWYTEDMASADVILLNSYTSYLNKNFRLLLEIKEKRPQTVILHRIDGPTSLFRDFDKTSDQIVYAINKLCVDGTIFQSAYSRDRNFELFQFDGESTTVIHNASDPSFFFPRPIMSDLGTRKIKLIAQSWSHNINKGFELYAYLDNHLDFERYEMTFIGNSPVSFRNIAYREALDSSNLGIALRDHDIYVTASRNDPCSNALIEALSCGLPAVALESGGHPELIKHGGTFFTSSRDILDALEHLVAHYDEYRSALPSYSIRECSGRYYRFAEYIIHRIADRKQEQKLTTSLPRGALRRIDYFFLKLKIMNAQSLIKKMIRYFFYTLRTRK